MADNEQTQVKPAAQPVKKRRFFRPRPKVKPEAEAASGEVKAITPKVSKPQPKPKNPQKPSNEQEKPAAKQVQQPKQKPIVKQEQQPKQKPAVKQEAKQQAPKAAPQKPKASNEAKSAKPKVNKPIEAKTDKPAAKPVENKQNKPAVAQKPHTSKHELHKLEAASQPAHKTTAKTNGTFKAHKPKGAPKQRLSDINFKYLDTPEFKDIYALVTNAQGYFAEDKGTCCAKFRIANEAIIERLIKDLQLEEAVAKKELGTNYFEQINLLSKNIPEDMVDGNVFAEMHNIRMIGNSFAHGDDKYDAVRGSKTCLIAMEKICQWLIVFEPKYLSYQRAKNLTKSNFFSDIWNGILSIFKRK